MNAQYDAECWSEGKSPAEIDEEIARIESMWTAGRDFQFPKSAHYQYCRMESLKEIRKLTNKKLLIG